MLTDYEILLVTKPISGCKLVMRFLDYIVFLGWLWLFRPPPPGDSPTKPDQSPTKARPSSWVGLGRAWSGMRFFRPTKMWRNCFYFTAMYKIAYNFCLFAVKNTKNALKMSKFPLNISLLVGSWSGLVGLGRAWPILVGPGPAWSGTRCQSGSVGLDRAWSGMVGLSGLVGESSGGGPLIDNFLKGNANNNPGLDFKA